MNDAGGVREVDHGGDVGIEAEAPDRARLFERMTAGLCALMASGAVDTSVERAVRATGADDATLLVDWLSEVIRLAATHGELYGAAEVKRVEDGVAEGVVRGEPVTPNRHQLRFDVKAATYHGLVCETTPRGVRARVIFDL